MIKFVFYVGTTSARDVKREEKELDWELIVRDDVELE